ITYPGALRGEKQDEFKRQVKSAYGGLGKHHRVMLMEDGMKFERIAAPPNEGQMFESRKFQVIEIARFFNVPPHKIMEMDRATYNNIEEMNIQFVNDSLMPHCRSIEQSSNQTLIFDFEKEKDGLYVEFNLNSLLKGRLEDRFNSYAKARQWGWLNVNEIRKMENMPDIGERGEVYMEPLNMRGAGEGGND
ncbi:MAG: phage portal protein, partial [Dethiosulfatibacter sp.]|nr:phage portal protein [Dethiosulfatibacter sp.]